MMHRLCPVLVAAALAASLAPAGAQSPNGVKTLDPPGAIKAEGTWSLGARAGDFVFVAGMQGIDPATNKLVEDPQARIRQAFLNIKTIAQSEGAPQGLRAADRLPQRLASLRSHGREGAARTLGRAALSAPNHGRGQAPVRRRSCRDRQRLLRAGEKVRRARPQSKSRERGQNAGPQSSGSRRRLVLDCRDYRSSRGETC